jgi:hypothetical protein
MDDRTTVRALLDAAGLSPPDEDVDALIEGYSRTRQMSALLFAVDEARYEPPASVFRPDPRYADWW